MQFLENVQKTLNDFFNKQSQLKLPDIEVVVNKAFDPNKYAIDYSKGWNCNQMKLATHEARKKLNIATGRYGPPTQPTWNTTWGGFMTVYN